MGAGLYQRWRHHFTAMESERIARMRDLAERRARKDGFLYEEIEVGEENVTPWAPFASKLDWSIAKWAIEEGIGHGQLDRLLEIPGVSLNYLLAIFQY